RRPGRRRPCRPHRRGGRPPAPRSRSRERSRARGYDRAASASRLAYPAVPGRAEAPPSERRRAREGGAMGTEVLDVEAVRLRFPGLAGDRVLLDGPGGSQAPSEVIDAMAAYLREHNANLGGAFASSVASDAVVESAREAAADLLGCEPGEA